MSTQRKAWNEAMKKAAGGTIPIAGLVQKDTRRSSSRAKRREKARKAITHTGDEGDGGGEDVGNSLVESRLDALEESSSSVLGFGTVDDMNDDEEEYDELEDLEKGKGSKGRRGKRKASSSKKQKNEFGQIPKRFKAKSLASVLIEESGRGLEDGILQQYLKAEAIPNINNSKNNKCRYPRRKFCPVSGLVGLYTDPKSGIPYANLTALEHIRERQPPWITGMSNNSMDTGSATYHEAVKSLKNNNE
mmetsp:Transcript_1694/g.2235  ORF Transcript_1694/g.2235 Transcript_1694/m.2235 type:complete len:247 (+) Transcript_1694:73-813(+)